MTASLPSSVVTAGLIALLSLGLCALTACKGSEDTADCGASDCDSDTQTDVDPGSDPDTEPDSDCPPDEYECDGDCSTLVDDVDNCGSCGNACDTSDFGDASCVDATCRLTCDEDTRMCGGNCSPCPDFATDTVCSFSSCIAVECEAGYTACGTGCLANPVGADEFWCDVDELVVVSCEGANDVAGNACECPNAQTLPSGAASGTFEATSRWIDVPSNFRCSTDPAYGQTSSMLVCPDPGLWMVRVRPENWDDVHSVIVGKTAADCDGLEGGRCEILSANIPWESDIHGVGVDGCLVVRVTHSDDGPMQDSVDLYGPVVRGVSVPLSISTQASSPGALNFPQGQFVAFKQLEITRTNTASSVTRLVEETLPSGEMHQHLFSFNSGQATRTLTVGLSNSESTFRLSFPSEFSSVRTVASGTYVLDGSR